MHAYLYLLRGYQEAFFKTWLVCVVAVALGVLVRGVWAHRRRQGLDAEKPRCARCGYIVMGIRGRMCPECGHDFEPRELVAWGLQKPLSVGWQILVWTLVMSYAGVFGFRYPAWLFSWCYESYWHAELRLPTEDHREDLEFTATGRGRWPGAKCSQLIIRKLVDSETLMRIDLRQMQSALNSPYESPVFSEDVTLVLIESVLREQGFRGTQEVLAIKARDVLTTIDGAAQGQDLVALAFSVYRPDLHLVNKASHLVPPAWFLVVWPFVLWCTGTCVVSALYLRASRRFREGHRAMLEQWSAEKSRS
jgi:hypothetical protein